MDVRVIPYGLIRSYTLSPHRMWSNRVSQKQRLKHGKSLPANSVSSLLAVERFTYMWVNGFIFIVIVNKKNSTGKETLKRNVCRALVQTKTEVVIYRFVQSKCDVCYYCVSQMDKPPFRQNQVCGSWHMKERLGTGGFGHVYLYQNQVSVCLKCINLYLQTLC